uniref:Adhesion G protein-coupled receptor E3 n=1 Tax=Anolis carolinensis TaxID=28377 RepID=A0A803T0U5_ANOCA
MRNVFSCLILGLGLVMYCGDGKSKALASYLDEKFWCPCVTTSCKYGITIPPQLVPANFSEKSWLCGDNVKRRGISMCSCEKGYQRIFRNVMYGMPETSCERISSHPPRNIPWENYNEKMCLNTTKADNANDARNFFCGLINDTMESPFGNNSSLENKVQFFEKRVSNYLHGVKSQEERVSAVTFALGYLGSNAAKRALENPREGVQTAGNGSIVIQTNLIKEESISENKAVILEAQEDQMTIYPKAVTDNANKGPVAVAFISYSGLGSFQAEGIFLQNDSLPNNEALENIHVNSRVVSASTSNLMRNIFSPVNLTFRHLENNKDLQEQVICVHWDSARGTGTWSSAGCHYLYSNATHTECSCQYLSNFAVLMATTPIQGSRILYIITYIGLISSVICLFLSVVTFLICHSIQNNNTFIHIQLSMCLFLADLLFLIGIQKTDKKILCSVIAGILHYLFLACFVWMFLEGLNLYFIVRNLKVANYRGARKQMKISMYFCGYGLPAVIVAIAAATFPEGYGTRELCWLKFEKGFVWSFTGPVCAIIVINLVLLCLILINLHQKFASLNKEVSTFRNTRALILKALAHVFILGVSWCLGLFLYGPLATVMAYLFTITNSVQGVFIFLVHCLFNKKKCPQNSSSTQQQSVEWGSEP